MNYKKVIAICGSTRQASINYSLIKAIVDLSAENLDITVFSGIAKLPQFDPDSDGEHVADEVADFRQLLNNAQGIIICTPEYAHGVPGTLKNAIDWTISSSQFPHKPTMLITASTDGRFGHKALLETLKAIEAKNIDNLQLVISFAKTKINNENQITDNKTLTEVQALLTRFIQTLSK
ncbi:MAG: NADPH-dependent FMN reductase [Chitinophagaceae bacterium]